MSQMDELAAAVASPRTLNAKGSGNAGGGDGDGAIESEGVLVGGHGAEEAVDINSMGDGVDRAKIEVSVVPKQPQAKQKCVFTANASRVRIDAVTSRTQKKQEKT